MTHPLLDLFTTYGTQLLAPLSDVRFAIDGIAIIDPIYSLPLLVGVVLASWRVGPRERGARACLVALLLSHAYLGFNVYCGARARDRLAKQLAGTDFTAERLYGYPMFVSPTLRRVVAADADGNLRVGAMNVFSDEPAQLHPVRWAPGPLVKAVLATEEGQLFQWFSTGLLSATVEPVGDGHARITLVDQRYGLFLDPAGGTVFAVHGEVDENGEVVDMQRSGRPQVDTAAEFAAAMDLLGR